MGSEPSVAPAGWRFCRITANGYGRSDIHRVDRSHPGGRRRWSRGAVVATARNRTTPYSTPPACARPAAGCPPRRAAHRSGDLQWLLPAGHVAWIPPSLPHALAEAEEFDGWSLYFSAATCLELPATPRIFQPSALLQSATARALQWPHAPLDAAQARLAGVIADEIAASTPLPLALPQPSHNRVTGACARSPPRWLARRTTTAPSRPGPPAVACRAAAWPATGWPRPA